MEYPKRLIREGHEPEMIQINNNCRTPILARIKKSLPIEYAKVMSEPIFAHVFAIHENGLHFSGRTVHAMLSRQLVTKKKHELWFVFGKKPLRFSLKEFHAITGMKVNDDHSCDLSKYTDDSGFWSKLLMRKEHISLKKLLDVYLVEAPGWENDDDRVRLVYLCVIGGLVLASGELKKIPLTHVQLVMDLDKVKTYPWGFVAFDYLVNSIVKRRDCLKNPSYCLDGFTYALQVWAMEAIHLIGKLLGDKINNELTEARCSNWRGSAKVHFDEILGIEEIFTENDVVYPYISSTGNYDIFDSVDFLRHNEIKDSRVDNLNALIKSGYDFKKHIWASLEDDDVQNGNIQDAQSEDFVRGNREIPQDENDVSHVRVEDSQISGLESNDKIQATNVEVSSSQKRKKKHAHIGVETRKRKLLYERAATSHGYTVNEKINKENKSLFTGLLHSSFKSFADTIDTRLKKFRGEIVTRLDKIEGEVSRLKELISTCGVPSNPAQEQGKFVDINFIFDKFFSQTGEIDINMGTQEFLREKVGHLSPKSYVPEVDRTQNLFLKESNMRPIKQESGITDQDSMKVDFVKVDSRRVSVPENDKDAVLVYVSNEKWEAFEAWSMKHENITLGPTVLDHKLFQRIIGKYVWLVNEEMDDMMYIYREYTSLGRFKQQRVGFMNCMFSMQLQNEHKKFLLNKRGHKRDTHLLAYANGELPSHGKTGKKWVLDFDRIYAPVFVNSNHWISVCVNFNLKIVEVFDCNRHNNRRNVESFAITIPRILKKIHRKIYGKNPMLTPYEIVEVPLPDGLNKSCSDCGVYALKYIECHLCDLHMDLINDENIEETRHRIAVDLWEAATDHVLIDRMKKFQPPLIPSEAIDID